MDPELQYQWFIAGLAPGERQSVTAWVADRELNGEEVGLDIMVQFLRIKERRNATATALADKGEPVGGGNPDLEPMDVEAVAAVASMRRREDRGEALTRGIIAGRPRSDQQKRTCFFCGKAGHMIKSCKCMQKAKTLERRDRTSRRRSPDISSGKPQGNGKAPTQRAAQ